MPLADALGELLIRHQCSRAVLLLVRLKVIDLQMQRELGPCWVQVVLQLVMKLSGRPVGLSVFPIASLQGPRLLFTVCEKSPWSLGAWPVWQTHLQRLQAA